MYTECVSIDCDIVNNVNKLIDGRFKIGRHVKAIAGYVE